jgi:hypothetical protein
MTQRLQSIRALLHTLDDWVPGPKTSTGALVQRSAVKGESPSRRIPCPACDGKGRLKNLRICERCGGNVQTGKSGRGFLEVDDYTGKEVTTEEQRGERKTVICSSCGGTGKRSASSHPSKDAPPCDPCNGWGRVAGEKLSTQGSGPKRDMLPWERAKQAMDEAGSYRELSRIMDDLRWQNPNLHDAARRLGQKEAGEELSQVEKWALEWISDRMPPEVKVPSFVSRRRESEAKKNMRWRGRQPFHEADRRERNDEIRRLFAEGWKVSRLSREFSLERRQIYNIVEGIEREAA